MAMNLVQHRGEQNVWDRAGAQWDVERWVVATVAGACLAGGFRRRSRTGLLLVLGGGALAWWAAVGADRRRHHKGQLQAVWPSRSSAESDVVHEASEESVPASDAPSWTPTTGNPGPAQTSRHGH